MGTEENVSGEALRELRNDFTFFVAMSVLKTMAVLTEDPKKFMRDMVWKWRELQINALGTIASEMEKKMFADEEFNAIFGEFMKKVNKAQRELLVSSIRKFCDSIEKVLVDSVDETKEKENEEEFNG
jgi:hypothetical protein